MVKGVRAKKSRGAALILYTLLLPTLLLMVGLAIDLSILYVVQTRLSTAVDGAALGAGRLLGTSVDTKTIAGQFLNASFPAGFWGSSTPVPNIVPSNTGALHTISVSATVQVPLLFLRILGQQNCTVAATATAVRRDVRIELVLDRSYSMTPVIANLRSAATTFVNMFNPGTDELGLVVFGTSAVVAYPTSETPNYSLTTGTGPDTHFADPVSGGGDNMLTLINALQVGYDTNTSEALWLAYKELLKARALDPDPNRANVIVLFTDGVPNGFTAYLNDPGNNALGLNSNCKYNPATNSTMGSTNPMIGAIATAGPSNLLGGSIPWFNPILSSGLGFFVRANSDPTNGAKYWVSGSGNEWSEVSGTSMTNCQHIGGTGLLGPGTDMSGLAIIPPQDYYGTSTNGTAYTQSTLYASYSQAYNSTQPTNGYQMGLASWNLADNTAQRIFKDSAMNITIYTIGYTGNGGIDKALLKRIANEQDATSYNSSYQTGLFVSASDAQSMQTAFGQVASQVLRLSK
jgi:Flp pilus assembly protein TadG